MVPLNPFGQKYKIGVMGSASGPFSAAQLAIAAGLGEAIGRRELVMITGACPGLPFEAARACHRAGGTVVGISPALSLEEHVQKYHSPTAHHDIIIYTGSGLMGREVINIRSCDMVILLAGKSGTLGEFSIAYDEGRLIGVLPSSGGISAHIAEIVRIINKRTGAEIQYDDDPDRLVGGLLARLERLYTEEGVPRIARFDSQPLPNGEDGPPPG